MNKFRYAFTLAETIIAMTILITVTALIIPHARKMMPNNEAVKFKNVYFGTSTIIHNMAGNARMYPDARGFADISPATDSLGQVYQGGRKFTDIFLSYLNIVNDNVTAAETGTFTAGTSGRVGRNLNFVDKNGADFRCVKTNNGAVFCLPQDVTDLFDARQPNSENHAVYIRVYIQPRANDTPDYSAQKAFYIGVRANGKVFLPNRDSNRFNCSVIQSGRMRDKDYNQCRANEYLSSSVIIEN